MLPAPSRSRRSSNAGPQSRSVIRHAYALRDASGETGYAATRAKQHALYAGASIAALILVVSLYSWSAGTEQVAGLTTINVDSAIGGAGEGGAPGFEIRRGDDGAKRLFATDSAVRRDKAQTQQPAHAGATTNKQRAADTVGMRAVPLSTAQRPAVQLSPSPPRHAVVSPSPTEPQQQPPQVQEPAVPRDKVLVELFVMSICPDAMYCEWLMGGIVEKLHPIVHLRTE